MDRRHLFKHTNATARAIFPYLEIRFPDCLLTVRRAVVYHREKNVAYERFSGCYGPERKPVGSVIWLLSCELGSHAEAMTVAECR